MTITYINDLPACATDKGQAATASAAATATLAEAGPGAGSTRNCGPPCEPVSTSDSPGLPFLQHVEPRVLLVCSRNLQLPQLPGVPLLGDLYVTDKMLYWYSDALKRGISVDYPSIGIHAVSREADAYTPGPCIYCQLDGDNFVEGDDDTLTEIRFVPENPASVDDVFQALSYCASLHPDKGSAEEYDEQGNDHDAPMVYYADGQQDAQQDAHTPLDSFINDANAGDLDLTPEGEATMNRLEAMLLEGEDDGHQR